MKVLFRLLLVAAILGGAVWVWRSFHPIAKPVVVRTGGVPEERPSVNGEGPDAGVWTSRDGRTLRGEYVSATETSVTVRREDGRVFTIPLANLTVANAAWVARQPRPRTITQQQVDEVVARFPQIPSLSGEVTNELRQLHEKYRGMVKFIRPGTVDANLKMIRSKIADDVKTLSQIAGTRSGDWSGKRGTSQSAAAEEGILSARRSLSWLNGPLSEHLQAYEGLLKTVE